MKARFAGVIALAMLVGGGSAGAVQLVGTSFADGMLYDVDAMTGAAGNARQIAVYPCDTPCEESPVAVTYVAGIEVSPAAPASFRIVTTLSNVANPNTVMAGALADPLVGFGFATPPLAAQIGEGDLALAPDGADLYAIGLTQTTAPYLLLRITSSEVQVVGQIGFSDVSGLAFDAAGTLYALDTGADTLLVLDPDDASTLASTPLSEPLGAVAGMDFDSTSGVLYVADGGTGGQDALFTLDVETGVLTGIGALGLANGLSGLAVVPEPGAFPLGAAGIVALVAWGRRRS